jgi:large subunit ribosomal protein L19
MGKYTEHKNTSFAVGDKIRVHHKIKESDKTRTQIFEGILIAIKGSQENKSITVRKIATGGVAVERIWPLQTPSLDKIEVVKKGKVRRSKLYYLRNRKGKKATRIKEGREKEKTIKVEDKVQNETKSDETNKKKKSQKDKETSDK